MGLDEIGMLVRVCVGALGTFCAILVWARTRDPAWVLIVLGVLLSYVGTIFETLVSLGLFVWGGTVFGLPAGQIAGLLLDNAPILLFAVAFVLVLVRHRM
jgi:hypothetical protein